MSNQNTDITNYNGTVPTVFKKLDSADYKVNPFEANKQFTFTSASAVEDGFLPLQGVYVNTLPKILIDNNETFPLNIDNSYQFNTYYSIDHLFYKYKNEPAKTFGPTNLNKVEKYLYQTASVFSIPQKRFGDGIKLDSFTWTNGSLTLNSDRHGNIFDINANSSSFLEDFPMFSEGFNHYFDKSKIQYESHNLNIQPGVTTRDGQKKPIGLSAFFSGSNYFQSDIEGYYDRDHDYSIAFWIYPAKNSTPVESTGLIVAKSETSSNQQYPFKIMLSSSLETNSHGQSGALNGKVNILFSVQSSENNKATEISSDLINGAWNFVCCQKIGHTLQTSINGNSFAGNSYSFIRNDQNTTNYINNNDKLSVGGFGPLDSNTDNYLNGSLDEIRIYDFVLTDAQVQTIYNGALEANIPQFLQNNKVGNVFGQTGFIVISTLDYRYHNLINENYTATYRSTVRRYEHSMFLQIDEGDFNVTLNPSALKDDNITVKGFVTGSSFAPYITTIGMFNDKGQMLMIGKLANPILNRTDIDLNIRMKIDLDRGRGGKI